MTDPLMDAANYISGLPIGLAPIQAGAVFPDPEPEPNSDMIAAIVAAGLQQAARDQAIAALVSSLPLSGAADDGGEPGLLQFATEMQGQGTGGPGDDPEFAALLAAIAAGGASQAGGAPAVGPDIPGMILEQGIKQGGKIAARELGVNDAINQGLDYVQNGITDLAGSVLGGGAGAGLTAAEIGTLLGASELSTAGGLLPALTLSGGGAGGAVAATSPAWGAFSAVPALGFAALAGLIGSDILTGGVPMRPEEHMTMIYNPETGQMEWSASAWSGGSQDRANANLEKWKAQWSGDAAPDFGFYQGETDPLRVTIARDLRTNKFYPEVSGGGTVYGGQTDTRNQPIGLDGQQYMGGINPAGKLEEYNSRASYSSPQAAIDAIMAWLLDPNETDYSYLIESQARQDGYADGGVMISGPGDGRADRVPILASDGEFIVPASDLSALGDGSSDAGARKLSRALEAVRMKHAAKLQRQKPPRL